MSLFSLLDQTATRKPDAGAVYLGSRQLLTFSELRHRVLQLAHALRLDYDAGSRVAILTENCPEYIEILFGIWAAGLVAVPVNFKLHHREVIQILEDGDVSLVFVSLKLSANLDMGIAESDLTCDRIVVGTDGYQDLFGSALSEPVEITPESLAWLFFTSGTTGRSKGAMLSHRNLMAMTFAHLADLEHVDENCSLVHAAPLSHGSGLYVLPYIAGGARQVLPESGGFDPKEFLDLCAHHPGVGVFFAPTMVQRLRVEKEASGRSADNLRTIIYGGAPMYVEEIRKSLAQFGQVFVQIYGQGEAPVTITGLRRRDHERDDELILGSVGQPRLGVEVCVVDPEGKRLPQGETGEIICRGDVVMSGYWNNPAATADTLRNGWLYTGDMGSFDARGYLTLRDRSKDVVISGGSNIYPREVEEVLLTHPAVSEVCVVGEPHEHWGEIVVAFIVKAMDANVSTDELDAHCIVNIARFKRPKKYVFVENLPKSNYGKVLKRELREQLLPANR